MNKIETKFQHVESEDTIETICDLFVDVVNRFKIPKKTWGLLSLALELDKNGPPTKKPTYVIMIWFEDLKKSPKNSCWLNPTYQFTTDSPGDVSFIAVTRQAVNRINECKSGKTVDIIVRFFCEEC